MMYDYQLTVGLFDKIKEEQLIKTEAAVDILKGILIEKHNIYAFTMINCFGCYKMQSTNTIVSEPSIRIEIASDKELHIINIINDIKTAFNQESIMLKKSVSDIDFI